MTKIKVFVITGLFAVLTFLSQFSAAQGVVIDLAQVREWMTSGKKAVLIDVRSPQEYREGHIPGAISIPAERIAVEQEKLPKDRKVPLIFYCRGMG